MSEIKVEGEVGIEGERLPVGQQQGNGILPVTGRPVGDGSLQLVDRLAQVLKGRLFGQPGPEEIEQPFPPVNRRSQGFLRGQVNEQGLHPGGAEFEQRVSIQFGVKGAEHV